MEFTDILDSFARKTGMNDAVPDPDGSIAFLFDDAHEITFTQDEDGSVFLYAVIGDAGHLDREGCLSLLRADLLGAETGGASFAVRDDELLLWIREQPFVDLPAFEAAVSRFLAQVTRWKDRVGEGVRTEASAGSQAPASGYPLNGMLQV